MDSPKSGKKKRTLIVIDGDALQEGARYDFSFLEREKRLEVWFFYKQRVHHSFRLRKDFSAQSVVLPRYEENLHLYILKRVCYELGRRKDRYKKVFLIGGHHPMWEGLVQFLRERDLSCTHVLAEDYRMEGLTTSAVEAAASVASPAHRSPSPETQSEPEVSSQAPRLPKTTQRTKAIYLQVIQSLQQVPLHTQMTRKEFREWLHRQGIRVKKDLPAQNLGFFLKRLADLGYLKTEGDLITVTAHA